MSLDCWRKPGYLERTCKLQTEKPRLAGGFEASKQAKIKKLKKWREKKRAFYIRVCTFYKVSLGDHFNITVIIN